MSEFEGRFILNAVGYSPVCAPSGENREHAVVKGGMALAEFTLKEGKLQTGSGMFLGKWIISSPHPHKALYYFSSAEFDIDGEIEFEEIEGGLYIFRCLLNPARSL